MDRITHSLMEEYLKENELSVGKESEGFEYFSTYCVVSNDYPESFPIEDVVTGGGGDTGIDGLAIIVNGTLVTSVEEIDDLSEINNFLDVDFIFVQAKTGNRFNSAEIGQFCFGVRDFFSQNPALPRSDMIRDRSQIQDRIFGKGPLFRRRKPNCNVYYVTTGKWQGDLAVEGRIDEEANLIKGLQLFDQVHVFPVDADEIQRLYRKAQNKVSAEIVFDKRTVFPEIQGVREAYLGLLPSNEFLKLIKDETGKIKKSLFYDNIRDWQGDNPVNQDIAGTISSPTQGQFPILNNGVTLVARNLQITGNRFHIEDYQIVNGCQTSHVIFNNSEDLGDELWVPVKVIVTDEDILTSRIIRATNRQTSIKEEELSALSDFQKKLEDYYSSFDDNHKLYYERRSKQYNDVSGIEKVRIVAIGTQIRCFSSMFLNEAHRASRYYGTLMRLVQENIFKPDHQPLAYYLSAYANYRLDAMFRNRTIDTKYRPFKYHILMGLRVRTIGSALPPFNSRRFDRECGKLKDVLWDDSKFSSEIRNITQAIDELIEGDYNRDRAKVQSFTEQLEAELGRI